MSFDEAKKKIKEKAKEFYEIKIFEHSGIKWLSQGDVLAVLGDLQKTVKELFESLPKPTIKIYHTHGDAQDYINELHMWVEKAEKLLETSK